MDDTIDSTPADHASCDGVDPQPVSNARQVMALKQRIRKYQIVIRQYNDAINRLGNMEFSVEELADDSNYFVKMGKLQHNILKARKMLKILTKRLNLIDKQNPFHQVCEIGGTTKYQLSEDIEDRVERPIERRVRFSGSGFNSIDKAITYFVNRKKIRDNSASDPNKVCCTFYEFPSSGDILKIIRQQNSKHNLQLTDATIETLAKKICNDVIALLKTYTVAERKQFLKDLPTDDTELICDPALNDSELAAKLALNKQLYLEASKEALYAEEIPELPELVIRESQGNKLSTFNESSLSTMGKSESDIIVKSVVSMPKVHSPKSLNELRIDEVTAAAPLLKDFQPRALSTKVIEIIDLLDDSNDS